MGDVLDCAHVFRCVRASDGVEERETQPSTNEIIYAYIRKHD